MAVLVPVPPGVVTETVPVVAPVGTLVWICDSPTKSSDAETPLNLIELAAYSPEPDTMTVEPTGAEFGLKLLITGTPATMKLTGLVPVPAGVVTVIGPVVAPTGMNALITVSLFTLQVVAGVPLNFSEVAPLKLGPRMLTPTVGAASTG